MKKLYIIRHGQTLFNKKGIFQGASDAPLTELGIRQTLATKNYLVDNEMDFSQVFVSPLGRCLKTKSLITDLEHTVMDGLQEWNFGNLEGELTQDVFANIRWGSVIAGELPGFFEDHGGESFRVFKDRVNSALEDIIAQTNEATLVVTHGGVMRLYYEIRNTMEELNGERFLNNCILEYNINGKNEVEFVQLHNPTKGVE